MDTPNKDTHITDAPIAIELIIIHSFIDLHRRTQQTEVACLLFGSSTVLDMVATLSRGSADTAIPDQF